MKKLLVIRYGAIGDQVMLTPVWKPLKDKYGHVTFYTNKEGVEVNKNNPHIDDYIIADQGIPYEARQAQLAELKTEFDRAIDFTGSIERSLLIARSQKELYYKSSAELHKTCNVNYYDHTLSWAGLPEIKGKNPTLWITEDEDKICKKFMKRYSKKEFVVMVAMAGSSPHKIYPWQEFIFDRLRHDIPIKFITVGDEYSKILEMWNKDTYNAAGLWSVRKSLIMTKYVDLVIGPETGVINAAGCFDTHKIVYLTHSSIENLTKYFKNCISLEPPEEIECHPCHKLIANAPECPVGQMSGAPACIANIHPKMVYESIMSVYKKVKNGNSNSANRRKHLH